MIHVYYANISILNSINQEKILSNFDNELRSKLQSYRRNDDKKRMLTSMYLLEKILIENKECYELKDLQYTSYGRPSFLNASFDFNISHSSDYVVVAFSYTSKVGIDIEINKPLQFEPFIHLFTKEIWDEIYSSKNKYATFYKYWTAYESVVKADGRGVQLVESKTLIYKFDKILVGQTVWHKQTLTISLGYSCTLSSLIKNPHIQLHNVCEGFI